MISGSHVSALDENGPDSGIRSVKFTGGESGRELLIWVEVRPLLGCLLNLVSHSLLK